MKYCVKCVFSSISATPLTFDEEGICSGCRASKLKDEIDWTDRESKFKELVNEYRDENNYDCLLPVSGGKDSYYQTHVIVNELGLKPKIIVVLLFSLNKL